MRSNLPLPTDVEPQDLTALNWPPASISVHGMVHDNSRSRLPYVYNIDFDKTLLAGVNNHAPFYVHAPPLLPNGTKLDTEKEDRYIHGAWLGDSHKRKISVKSRAPDNSEYGKADERALKGWYAGIGAQDGKGLYDPLMIIMPQLQLVDHRWSNTDIYASEIGNSIQWDPRKRINRNPVPAEEPIHSGDGYDSFWIKFGTVLAFGTGLFILFLTVSAAFLVQ